MPSAIAQNQPAPAQRQFAYTPLAPLVPKEHPKQRYFRAAIERSGRDKALTDSYLEVFRWDGNFLSSVTLRASSGALVAMFDLNCVTRAHLRAMAIALLSAADDVEATTTAAPGEQAPDGIEDEAGVLA